jgi:CheY-like chemotaxis protein
LRNNPSTVSARQVAMSGWGLEQVVRHALTAGFDEVLVKPIDADQLRRLLAATAAPPPH